MPETTLKKKAHPVQKPIEDDVYLVFTDGSSQPVPGAARSPILSSAFEAFGPPSLVIGQVLKTALKMQETGLPAVAGSAELAFGMTAAPEAGRSVDDIMEEDQAQLAERGIKVIPSLGGAIVPKSALNEDMVKALGAKVYPNLFMPVHEKLPSQPADAPNQDMPWHLRSLRVEKAYDQGYHGEGMLAGVADTGIDPDHPEFADKEIYFQEFDQNGSPMHSAAWDAGSHGTHVSATIAGHNVGVAPAADLTVAAVLTFEDDQGRLGGYLAQIAAGFGFLTTVNHRADSQLRSTDIVNASLGSPGYNDYYYQALNSAALLSNILTCAAIGNYGRYGMNNHGSPGNYDVTIGVGAVDEYDDVAPFSDWGTVPEHGDIRVPDLAAPGVDVISATPGQRYEALSGTSMASPMVAGIALLLQQKDPSLQANANRLRSNLLRLLRPHQTNYNQARGGMGIADLTNF